MVGIDASSSDKAFLGLVLNSLGEGLRLPDDTCKNYLLLRKQVEEGHDVFANNKLGLPTETPELPPTDETQGQQLETLSWLTLQAPKRSRSKSCESDLEKDTDEEGLKGKCRVSVLS